MSTLLERAREYLTDKYLDLVDVPKFIEAYVRLDSENKSLRDRVNELSDQVAELVADRDDLIERLEHAAESHI